MNKFALCLLVVVAVSLFGCLSLSGGTGSIKVAVIGTASPEMKSELTSEDFKVAGITYSGDIDQSKVYNGVLKDYDIVMLQGEAVCDRTMRKVVADFVEAGGKLIVIQDACTRVSNDNSAYGWDIGTGSLGDVMPVSINGSVKGNNDPISGKLRIVDLNSPMLNGIMNFEFNNTRVTIVSTPKADSNVLAYIDSSSVGSATAPTMLGIVETKGLIAGKTLYFAFDPATMAAQGTGRNLFLNALFYLHGQKG